MKKLTFAFFAVFLLISTSLELKAQTYKYALGGRLGAANGITFKTFTSDNAALDFILNFQSKKDYSYFRFTGLYEIHNPINNAPGLRWYYGGGGTLGSVEYKPTNESDFLVSVDGVLGLDYKFDGAPINLALDWKPAIEVTPNTEFDANGIGLSIRFTF
ncbi:hypothetical protein [Rubrolithibacter danxiaensis]|uniref:hypothetical protein n=1 Tax=Rubrolithibacter danxiaensis TaxID=3390805 RepID=UPI003BF8870A